MACADLNCDPSVTSPHLHKGIETMKSRRNETRVSVIRSRNRLLAALSHVTGYKFFPGTKAHQQARRIYHWILNNANRHYVADSVDNPGLKISYAQSPKHKCDPDKRMKTTFAKYVGRNLNLDDFGRIVLDEICNYLRAMLANIEDTITIAYGYDVQKLYRDDFGESSCMSGDDSDYVELYALNENNVSMLCYDDGSMQARCLLWNAYRRDGSAALVSDRIYPNCGYHVDIIQQWLKRNDYVLRKHHGLPTGREYDDRFHVDLIYQDHIPYMDSFCNMDPDGRFSTYYRIGSEVCNNTDGEIPFDRIYCCTCDERIHDDEIYRSECGDEYCESCHSHRFATCERCSCEVDTDYEGASEVRNGRWAEYWCDSCDSTDADTCYGCDERFRHDYLDTFSEDGELYCESCMPEETEEEETEATIA